MRKFISTFLAVVMSLTVTVPVFAADITSAGGTGESSVVLKVNEPTFSVTVPTSLAISVAADGTVTSATEAAITNLSHGMVRITDVAVEGENGWEVIDWGTDLSNVAVNTKQIGMQINGDVTDAEDPNGFVFTQSNWADLDAAGGANDTLEIDYAAIIPAQSASASDSTIASVVFTVGWATN